jgi:pimeloyl-ACP methyl ester carboxylesterase
MTVTVLLLPGLDGTGALFVGAAPPPGLALTIVDYPCERPVPRTRLIEAILAALPSEGPVILVGESFSGPLALEAAARVPRLIGVVLLASFARPPRARLLIRLVAWLGPWLFRRPPPRLAVRVWMTGRSPALITRVRGAIRSVASEVLSDRLRQIADVDARESLRTCPVPVLALVADHDRLVPRRAIEGLRTLRPDLRVVTLPGPHLLFQHDPDAVLGAILEWTTRAQGTGSLTMKPSPLP